MEYNDPFDCGQGLAFAVESGNLPSRGLNLDLRHIEDRQRPGVEAERKRFEYRGQREALPEFTAGPCGTAHADAPEPVNEFGATITLLAERPLWRGARALLRYGTSTTRVIVSSIDGLLDIDSLTYQSAPDALALNDIAKVTLRTADPLPVEDYRPGGAVGSLLIIEPSDGTTLAAGMVGDRRAALHASVSSPSTTTGNTAKEATA